MTLFCAFAFLPLQKHILPPCCHALGPAQPTVGTCVCTHTVCNPTNCPGVLRRSRGRCQAQDKGSAQGPLLFPLPLCSGLKQPGTHGCSQAPAWPSDIGLRQRVPSPVPRSRLWTTPNRIHQMQGKAPSPPLRSPIPLEQLPRLLSLLLCLCVGVFGNEIFPAELQNEMQRSQLLE